MKRNWKTWLTITIATVWVGSANAQTPWDQPTEIGSYQAILARAGYRTVNEAQPSPYSESEAPGPTTDTDAPAAATPMGSCGGSCGDVYAQTGGLRGRLGNCQQGSKANHVLSVRGLYIARDYEDDVRLTRNGAGDILYSTDADMGLMGGVETSLTRRDCCGNGLQITYWGLYPGQQSYSLSGPGLNTYLTGFNDLRLAPGAQNLLTYFNNSDSNAIYRDNEIHNIELNLLRNGGNYTTRGGRCGNFEFLGGFRWFQFNEDFRYTAFYASANPDQVDYEINNRNSLMGFQIGGRNEICLNRCWSLVAGSKLGLFNNHIESEQCICDSNGVFAYETSSGVDDYNYSNEKNDLSMLGELDLGLAYRFSSCVRATFGYRVVGISGISLATDQIPQDFTNSNEINRIKSNGDLILGGGYAGLEFCY